MLTSPVSFYLHQCGQENRKLRMWFVFYFYWRALLYTCSLVSRENLMICSPTGPYDFKNALQQVILEAYNSKFSHFWLEVEVKNWTFSWKILNIHKSRENDIMTLPPNHQPPALTDIKIWKTRFLLYVPQCAELSESKAQTSGPSICGCLIMHF